MAHTRHIQARLEDHVYQALERWAQSHNVSLTSAVVTAVRTLTGLAEHPTKPPQSLMGALADTDVMGEMEKERTREIKSDQRWR